MVKINVTNTIGPLCIDVESGQRLYDLIVKAFKEEKKVILSFLNIDLLTPTFLNAVVGQLYKDFSVEFVKNHLGVENMSQNDLAMLKKVVDNAKSYYKKMLR